MDISLVQMFHTCLPISVVDHSDRQGHRIRTADLRPFLQVLQAGHLMDTLVLQEGLPSVGRQFHQEVFLRQDRQCHQDDRPLQPQHLAD